MFTICLNSYRASGTGGYDCYVGCPVVREIGTEMSDLILDYFKQYGDAMRSAAAISGSFRLCGATDKRRASGPTVAVLQRFLCSKSPGTARAQGFFGVRH